MLGNQDQQIEKIVAVHGAALVLYARQWCYTPDDALQEALIDLMRAPAVPNDIAAWLFYTVRFKAMNIARSERRRMQRQNQVAAQREPWFDNTNRRNQDADELERQLQKLSDLEREIVVARIWGDLSFQQISELTNKPTSTVHRHYQQAVAQLKVNMTSANNSPVGCDRVSKNIQVETK